MAELENDIQGEKHAEGERGGENEIEVETDPEPDFFHISIRIIPLEGAKERREQAKIEIYLDRRMEYRGRQAQDGVRNRFPFRRTGERFVKQGKAGQDRREQDGV
ncbi:MAG: hypothetical protein JXD23_09940 [Spirochaetales bacterium]|nr:hypothetical protein [Spirochaetales bacterium]